MLAWTRLLGLFQWRNCFYDVKLGAILSTRGLHLFADHLCVDRWLSSGWLSCWDKVLLLVWHLLLRLNIIVGVPRLLVSASSMIIHHGTLWNGTCIWNTSLFSDSRSKSHLCVFRYIRAASSRLVLLVAKGTLGSSILVGLYLSVHFLTANFTLVEVRYAASPKKVFSLVLVLWHYLWHLIPATYHIICLFTTYFHLLCCPRYFARIVAFNCTCLLAKPLNRLAMMVMILWRVAPLQEWASFTLNQPLHFTSIAWEENHFWGNRCLLLVVHLLVLTQFPCLSELTFDSILNGHEANVSLRVTIKHYFAWLKGSERLAQICSSLPELSDLAFSFNVLNLLFLLFSKLVDPTQVRSQIDRLHQLCKFIESDLAIRVGHNASHKARQSLLLLL